MLPPWTHVEYLRLWMGDIYIIYCIHGLLTTYDASILHIQILSHQDSSLSICTYKCMNGYCVSLTKMEVSYDIFTYIYIYTPHVYTFVVYPYMRGWPVAFSSSKSSCISSTTVTAYHSLEETFWSLWKRHLPADEKSGISSVKEVYNNVLGKFFH